MHPVPFLYYETEVLIITSKNNNVYNVIIRHYVYYYIFPCRLTHSRNIIQTQIIKISMWDTMCPIFFCLVIVLHAISIVHKGKLHAVKTSTVRISHCGFCMHYILWFKFTSGKVYTLLTHYYTTHNLTKTKHMKLSVSLNICTRYGYVRSCGILLYLTVHYVLANVTCTHTYELRISTRVMYYTIHYTVTYAAVKGIV
jgi:hypothetical protein